MMENLDLPGKVNPDRKTEIKGVREYSPAEIFKEAKKNPQGFLENKISEMKDGFLRDNFVPPESKADVVILIPSHNETVGDKAGNLYACLYAISKQKMDPNLRVKLIIIAHNCDPEDKENLSLLKNIFPKLEIISFDSPPPLRGFSFPLSLGVLSLGDDEAKVLGIIDADTVINPNWITNMLEKLLESETTGAVVGPREYYTNDGNRVPYGTIKHCLERLSDKLNLPFIKLVTGNSMYRIGEEIKDVFSRIGILTDGIIQEELENRGLNTKYCEGGFAVSEGGKFKSIQNPLALFSTVVNKFAATFLPRSLLPPKIHLAFIDELKRYFPDLGEMIDNAVLNTDNPQELLKLYKEILDEYNRLCQTAFKEGQYVKITRENRPFLGKMKIKNTPCRGDRN